jgi:hypothetical protein
VRGSSVLLNILLKISPINSRFRTLVHPSASTKTEGPFRLRPAAERPVRSDRRMRPEGQFVLTAVLATPVAPWPFSNTAVRAPMACHRLMPARRCLAAVAVAKSHSPPWPSPASLSTLACPAEGAAGPRRRQMPARQCLAARAAAVQALPPWPFPLLHSPTSL